MKSAKKIDANPNTGLKFFPSNHQLEKAMGKKFISSDEAVQAKCQHKTPCSDCPWRRDSLNGWLGGASAEEWIQVAHGDQVVPCHTLKGAQCAGIAVYRANVAKMPYAPNLKLPADRELVFAWPPQFLEHHSKIPGKTD